MKSILRRLFPESKKEVSLPIGGVLKFPPFVLKSKETNDLHRMVEAYEQFRSYHNPVAAKMMLEAIQLTITDMLKDESTVLPVEQLLTKPLYHTSGVNPYCGLTGCSKDGHHVHSSEELRKNDGHET